MMAEVQAPYLQIQDFLLYCFLTHVLLLNFFGQKSPVSTHICTCFKGFVIQKPWGTKRTEQRTTSTWEATRYPQGLKPPLENERRLTQDVVGEVNWQAANEVLVCDTRKWWEGCRMWRDVPMGWGCSKWSNLCSRALWDGAAGSWGTEVHCWCLPT